MSDSPSIPNPVLKRLGKRKLKLHRHTIRVDVATNPEIMDKFVRSELYPYVNEDEDEDEDDYYYDDEDDETAIVAGFDTNYTPNSSKDGYLILCMPNNYCLVARFENNNLSPLFKKFVEDCQKICLIGTKQPSKLHPGIAPDKGIGVGEFAARALTDPELCSCEDLGRIAERIGVRFDASVDGGREVSEQCTRYWNDQIFNEGELKALVYRAYMCRKVGMKLLKKLLC